MSCLPLGVCVLRGTRCFASLSKFKYELTWKHLSSRGIVCSRGSQRGKAFSFYYNFIIWELEGLCFSSVLLASRWTIPCSLCGLLALRAWQLPPVVRCGLAQVAPILLLILWLQVYRSAVPFAHRPRLSKGFLCFLRSPYVRLDSSTSHLHRVWTSSLCSCIWLWWFHFNAFETSLSSSLLEKEPSARDERPHTLPQISWNTLSVYKHKRGLSLDCRLPWKHSRNAPLARNSEPQPYT